MGKAWSANEESRSYEIEVRILLEVLRRANAYLNDHPEKCGLFNGRKGPADRKLYFDSQKKLPL